MLVLGLLGDEGGGEVGVKGFGGCLVSGSGVR